MNPISAGFADELTKVGGLLSKFLGRTVLRAGKTVARNPMRALGVGMIAVPTLMAAKAGYESGANPGESRQLAAGRGEDGRIHASEAAYTNYHDLLPHKARAHEVRALSKNYNEDMFPAVLGKSKGK